MTPVTRAAALLLLALPGAVLEACGESRVSAGPSSDAGTDAGVPHLHDASIGNDTGDDDDDDDDASDAGVATKDAATDGDALDAADAADTGPVLGGDPGPIGDAGVCTLVPGAHPIQNVTVSNVVVSGDATQTIIVPDGFVLRGTITAPMADNHPLAKGSSAFYLYLYNPATGGLYAWSGSTSGYSMTVPAGRYFAEYSVGYDIWDHGSNEPTNNIALRGVDIIDVCGDAVHDVALRSLPTLAPVTLAVSGIDRLHLNGSLGANMGLVTADGTLYWQGPAGDGSRASETITTLLPLNETLLTLVSGERLPNVVAASTMTLALPTQVNLTGSVTMQAGQKGGVQCDVATSNPLLVPRAWPGDSERFWNALPAAGPVLDYTLPIRAGAACKLTASVSSTTGVLGLLTNAFTSVPVPVSALADATYDFTAPTPDPPVNVTFVVVDARGAPLATAQAVGATSSELAGGGAGWTALASGAPTSGTLVLALPPATYAFTVSN